MIIDTITLIKQIINQINTIRMIKEEMIIKNSLNIKRKINISLNSSSIMINILNSQVIIKILLINQIIIQPKTKTMTINIQRKIMTTSNKINNITKKTCRNQIVPLIPNIRKNNRQRMITKIIISLTKKRKNN